VHRTAREIGAVVAAVGGAGGTLWSKAETALAIGEDPWIAGDRAADDATGGTVVIVAAEINADSAAVGQACGTGRSTDTGAALADLTVVTLGAAGAAMIGIG
jgi:hypothetical protein